MSLKTMTYRDKIDALKWLGLRPREIASAMGMTRTNLYYTWRKDTMTCIRESILDRLIHENRKNKTRLRPAWRDMECGNPIRHLIKEMKFTPEEVAKHTGYSVITIEGWRGQRATMNEFTKDKLVDSLPKFKALRDAEATLDCLDEYCDTHGFARIPEKVEVNVDSMPF